MARQTSTLYSSLLVWSSWNSPPYEFELTLVQIIIQSDVVKTFNNYLKYVYYVLKLKA